MQVVGIDRSLVLELAKRSRFGAQQRVLVQRRMQFSARNLANSKECLIELLEATSETDHFSRSLASRQAWDPKRKLDIGR